MSRTGLCRRFSSDRRGVSAVEFAVIAPLLIACYLALAELCGAMIAERRAAHVASTVGDLVAQVPTINAAGMTDVFSVSTTILKPMSAAPLSMRVSSIASDATGKTTIVWSQVYGTGLPALGAGSPITVPAGMLPAKATIIKSEVAYPYVSPVAQLIPNGLRFNEVFYLRPRTSDAVVWTTP